MNDGLAFPFAIAVAFAMMGVDTAVSVLPRAELASFYEVESVTAVRSGNTAILEVDRTVHRPIHMSFIVRVHKQVGAGWQEICHSEHGPFLYQPDNIPPDPITLDWWTWGDCVELPPGEIRISTTWIPEPKGMQPVTVVTRVE